MKNLLMKRAEVFVKLGYIFLEFLEYVLSTSRTIMNKHCVEVLQWTHIEFTLLNIPGILTFLNSFQQQTFFASLNE